MTLKCSSENLWEPKAAPLDGALFSPAANFFYNFYNFFYNFITFSIIFITFSIIWGMGMINPAQDSGQVGTCH